MANTHATLKLFRSFHFYIGVFTAPALLFFALTGALQTFSLHETTPGSNYKPPAWIAMLAQIHKKQTDVVPARKPKEAPTNAATAGPLKLNKAFASSGVNQAVDASQIPVTSRMRPKSHMPMKIFFLLVAVGLFTSTLTGLYMAYQYCRDKIMVVSLFLAGVIIPIVLLAF